MRARVPPQATPELEALFDDSLIKAARAIARLQMLELQGKDECQDTQWLDLNAQYVAATIKFLNAKEERGL